MEFKKCSLEANYTQNLKQNKLGNYQIIQK